MEKLVLKMSAEYIIYADESIDKGKYFSNFYGGVLIRSQHIEYVRETLDNKKLELNCFDEIKWSKVTKNYLSKYQALMETFFDLIQDDVVKLRVMFTQNALVPQGLTQEQRDNEFFLLYYQFIKHAFGLKHSNDTESLIRLRLYFDKLPDTREKVQSFKGYLAGLNQSTDFQQARLQIFEDQIAEIDSHEHSILQCLDVVLGSMQFRLNDLHKVKPEGARRRGKRTIAKDRLYRLINRRIRQIYPNFNIGISTGVGGDLANRWRHPYRHWLFQPRDYSRDKTKYKGK